MGRATEINLFGEDLRATSPKVSSMSHMNCHYIADPRMEKQRILIGFPGSEKFAYTGTTTARAIHTASNGKGVYVINGKKVSRITRSGVVILIGEIESESGPISMADSGIQLMIVDGRAGYIINLDFDDIEKPQEVTKIDAEFFPNNCSSVIFQMGRFLVNELGTEKFYGSDIFDGFAWDGLNFASAETYPDNITALVNGSFGVFYLLGSETIETWYNTGGPDFPYANMSGGLIQAGLLSVNSVVKLEDNIIFLGKSQASGVKFFALSGQNLTDITNPAINEIIGKLRLPSLVRACGYSSNGSSIYQVTFSESGRTFFYDFRTRLWGERLSRGLKGHIWDIGAYGAGNQYFTSKVDGTIYLLNTIVSKDGDYFQDLEFIGRHLDLSENRVSVSSIQFVMEVGQGEKFNYNEAPKVMLSYSKDGGFSYTPEIQGSLGKIGDYLVRLIWRRLGFSRDMVFKLRITDLVQRKIISALMELKA